LDGESAEASLGARAAGKISSEYRECIRQVKSLDACLLRLIPALEKILERL